jgi:hypothetical protein
MNDLRRAAEVALQYFEDAYGLEDEEVVIKEALRQALAHEALDEMVAENQRLGLYDDAAPQKRDSSSWVGLTDEEIQAERHKLDPTAGWTYDHFARAIEAKLKEKNT